MDEAREFFSLTSVATLAGASAAVVGVTNTLRKLFGLQAIRTSAVAAFVLVYAGAHAAGALSSPMGYVLAFVNACTLFCTVIGMQEFAAGVGATQVAQPSSPYGRKDVRFFGSWMHPEAERVRQQQKERADSLNP